MSNSSPNGSETGLPPTPRGGLFLKYVAMFVAIVSLALAINGVSDIWFSYHEQQNLLFRIQGEQARSAADKIGQFLNEITSGLLWETRVSLSESTVDEWKFDAVRVMRQVPALAEIVQLDATGREQYRMSREAPDVIESHVDHSQEAAFIQAMANKVYYGPRWTGIRRYRCPSESHIHLGRHIANKGGQTWTGLCR
jgi:two-component system NtrC family sensor kinase